MYEKIARIIVDKLPKSVVYYCVIRMWAYGTTGKYSQYDAYTITVNDIISRWKD